MDINTIGHPLIAVAYVTLAILSVFVKLPGRNETIGAKIGGVLFFTGCAVHHIDMGIHWESGSALDNAHGHHTVATLMQAIGAPLFIVSAGPYVRDLLLTLRNPGLLAKLRARGDE